MVKIADGGGTAVPKPKATAPKPKTPQEDRPKPQMAVAKDLVDRLEQGHYNEAGNAGYAGDPPPRQKVTKAVLQRDLKGTQSMVRGAVRDSFPQAELYASNQLMVENTLLKHFGQIAASDGDASSISQKDLAAAKKLNFFA